jgi:hypothetical protein
VTGGGVATRAAAYGIVPAFAADDPAMALLLGMLGLATGLAVERVAARVADETISIIAAAAVLTSLSFGGIDERPALSLVWLVVGSVLAMRLTQAPERVWPHAGIGFAVVLIVTFAGSASSDRLGPNVFLLGSSLFGSSGLLYNAPLLWLGFAGLLALRRERPKIATVSGAVVLAGFLTQFFGTHDGAPRFTSMIWIAFLVPGIAKACERLRGFALRSADDVVACCAVLVVLWNALFMEQYRRRFLPSDETVSFSRVTANNAALLSQFVGTPVAWPANWVAAKALDIPLQTWDAVSGRDLFRDATSRTATIEFGDDPSILAPDKALMLEGFRARRTCGSGWCRDLDERGRIVLPLRNAGAGPVTLTIRVRGEGTLRVSLNDTTTRVQDVGEGFVDFTLSSRLEPGLHVVSLQTNGRATIDRITLARTTTRD